MTYLEKKLLPGEQIQFRTKKHFIIFLTPLIITAAVLYLHLLNNPYLSSISWIFSLVMVFSWGYQFLEYFTADYIVTNKRVMSKEGFFFRRANEMRLAVITRVDIGQSILGQLLRYGNVIVHGFGDSIDIFSLVQNPFEFQQKIQMEMDRTSK